MKKKNSNLWDVVKGGIFKALKAYSRKQERSKVNNLRFHFKIIKKEN